MNQSELLERYIEIAQERLLSHHRAMRCLERNGVTSKAVLEAHRIGFSDDFLSEFADSNAEIKSILDRIGLLDGERDRFRNCIIIPIFDSDGTPVNLVGYSIYPQRKPRTFSLNEEGIFNESYLKHVSDVFLAPGPTEALSLIERDIPHVSFVIGDDGKYDRLFSTQHIKRVTFLYEGHARLFHRITASGISARRVVTDFDRIVAERIEKTDIIDAIEQSAGNTVANEDTITEIEHGFLFRLSVVTYRVIGSFSDATMSMKANIKATKDDEVFVDSIDLYKHRDRQRFLYNLMDRLRIRDQVQLEQDLNTIVSVIERHKEAHERDGERTLPVLTDHQKSIGLSLLEDAHLCDRIDEDFSRLGYVRERKNKLLLYLVMTSRLMRSPLHAMLIARSGAGNYVKYSVM